MTSKLTRQDQAAPPDELFPVFPPRGDMQNFLYLNRPGLPGALERHFGISNSTVILGEAPLRWTPSQQRGHRIPDLMVAFDVDRDRAVKQMGYSIREQGKPPDFVLEVASVNTGFQDYTGKRTDYAAFGVPEYWRVRSIRWAVPRCAPSRGPAGGRRVPTHRNRTTGRNPLLWPQRRAGTGPLLGGGPAPLLEPGKRNDT